MARRYSEDDARRIFARVAERQTASGPADGGLSLADLQEAARAAGLDPSLVAQAAAELDRAAPTPQRLVGAPVEITVSRVISGTLTDDVWAAIVAEARAQFRGTGTAGQIGRQREWSVISGGAKNGVTTHLTAEPVDGGIRLTISQSIRDMVLGFSIAGGITSLMAILFTTLAVAGVDSELWIPAVMMSTMALLFLGGTHVGARQWQTRRARRFESVLDRFELIARDDAGEADGERASPTEAGLRLDLDALADADLRLGDAPETASTADPRRTRA